jgi:hypothetical protein
VQQPDASHRSEDGGLHGWLSIHILGGLVGGLIFYVHARLVGGSAEDHLAWQTGWGVVIGLLVSSLIYDGIVFEYQKVNSSGDGTQSLWRFARTWKCLLFVAAELLALGFAIVIMSNPNDFAPEFSLDDINFGG